MKVKTPLIFILIDAFRHDALNSKATPFMYKLAEKGLKFKLRPTLAYEGRGPFFSGMYPENFDLAFRYIYSPETSPFKFTKYIKNLPIDEKYKRKIVDRIFRRRAKEGLVKRHLNTRFIPIDILENIDFGEKEYHWTDEYMGEKETLFKRLKKAGYTSIINSWPSSEYGLSISATLRLMDEKLYDFDKDLIYLTVSDTDWAEHKYGPDSYQYKIKLRMIDTLIETLFERINNLIRKEPNLFVFGDHGAVKVNKIFDLEKKLQKLTDLKNGKDYVCLIDSAIVRFWFRNNKVKELITSFVKDLGSDIGIILNDDLKKKYHFNLSRNLVSDLLFLAHPGVLFFPNIHNRGKPEKGMHGYDPDHHNELAAGLIYSGENQISFSEEKENDIYEMIDVYPTTLELLGLKSNNGIDGRTIIRISKTI